MKTVASLRVSTAQQGVRSQRLAILEYARHHDVSIDEFIEATASGQASDKRRRLDELLHILQRGNRVVVSELSRLGRSLGQIVAILDALAKADVAFVALKEHICVEGTRDIQTKVITTLLGTDPGRHMDKRVAGALRRHETLRVRIEGSKTEYQTIGGETGSVWKPETERIERVIVKNARGHAFYEYGEPMLIEPEHVLTLPLASMTAAERKEFDTAGRAGELASWPEVGSLSRAEQN